MDSISLLGIIAIILAPLLIYLLGRLNIAGADQRAKFLDELFEVKKLSTNGSYSIRDGIIRSDNILAKALQKKYKNTLSCGENLKRANNLFDRATYNKIWEAHKLRNLIVHEDLEVEKKELEFVYKTYTTAINKILR